MGATISKASCKSGAPIRVAVRKVRSIEQIGLVLRSSAQANGACIREGDEREIGAEIQAELDKNAGVSTDTDKAIGGG